MRTKEEAARGGDKERKTHTLFPLVHILGLLHGRASRSPTLEWSVVGYRESAPRARFIPLPCRALLLDDRIYTALMGPVGAPEIPTRTGHNARLKVGFTTDRQDPDGWNHVQQGRTVTSPGLLPSPSRPSILCPYLPAAFLPLLVFFAPASSSFVLVLHPGPAAILAILLFSLPPLFSRPPSPRARYATPMAGSCARPETPCISPDRTHATTFRGELEEEKREENGNALEGLA